MAMLRELSVFVASPLLMLAAIRIYAYVYTYLIHQDADLFVAIAIGTLIGVIIYFALVKGLLEFGASISPLVICSSSPYHSILPTESDSIDSGKITPPYIPPRDDSSAR